MTISEPVRPRRFFETDLGVIFLGNSLDVLHGMEDNSVNLVMTSPPFGLVRKKDYGNVDADEYIEWFTTFAQEIHRVLTDNGSFVLDIGGAWNAGLPTRHLYHFKLVIMLCEKIGFHLAQDFYWWNPSRLPSPAEWVTVRRIRVKDAINTVWWLSKTPWPKASNRRVLQPYSESMEELLVNGYKAKKRPSGHDISKKFAVNNGAAIPPNLLAIPNTESNSHYLRYCKQHNIEPHPARYPADLPEYFIRFLTDTGDLVVDPFAGSCVTGEVAERLERRWICSELNERYLEGARGRFVAQQQPNAKQPKNNKKADMTYNITRPSILWNGKPKDRLVADGGRKRIPKPQKTNKLKLLGKLKVIRRPKTIGNLRPTEHLRVIRKKPLQPELGLIQPQD